MFDFLVHLLCFWLNVGGSAPCSIVMSGYCIVFAAVLGMFFYMQSGTLFKELNYKPPGNEFDEQIVQQK